MGYDHLLFVLALILIVRNLRVLIATVTAFTVAHSITLALATLGVVHVPGPPVEAAIALSILLLACEIARTRAGATEPHGAVALAGGILVRPPARLRFRRVRFPKSACRAVTFHSRYSRSIVGVEIGQLVFIAAVLASLAAVGEFRFRTTCRDTLDPSRPTRSAHWPRSGSSSASRDFCLEPVLRLVIQE